MSQKNGPKDPGLLPDGGFGWVIVGASFLSLVIVDGIIFSFGVFFGEIESFYKTNKQQTALIGSLLSGFYLLVGPMVSALANKYSCQKVTIGGSLVASSGFILSVFAPNTDVLCLTYGIIIGIGFGMIYLPSIVMVGTYFNQRRALATGIAVSGSSIGTFMFAQLSKYLIDEYTWQGATLIMAAIVLHCIAAGLLFRPLEEYVSFTPKESIIEKIDDPSVIPEEQEYFIKPNIISNGLPPGLPNGVCVNILESQDIDQTLTEENIEYVRERAHSIVIPHIIIDTISNGMYAEINAVPSGVDDKLQIPATKYNHKSSYERLTEEENIKSNSVRKRSKTDEKLIKRFRKRILKPFYRNDIFLSKSSLTLPEICAIQHNEICSFNEVDMIEKQVTICGCFKISQDTAYVLKNMLDVSLLRSQTFILLCISAFMTFLGIFIPFIFIISYAEECNHDKNYSTNLVSIIGATNTIGRILSGWASDKLQNKALFLNNVALTLGGLATCICPLTCNYILLCVCCGIFGLAVATFASLRSIILVELLGLEKLSNAFGLNILFMGIACIMGPPFAGYIYDVSESYLISFIIAGIFIALSGLIAFPLPRLRQWELKKQENVKHLDLYAELPSTDV